MTSQEQLQMLLSKPTPPLRQRRQRTNFSEEVIEALEEAFAKNPYPDINEREAMARDLKTNEDRVQVWFQNKRARFRKRMQKENTSVKSAKNKIEDNVKESDSSNLEKSPSRILQNKKNQSNEELSFDQGSNNSTSYDSGIYSPTNSSHLESNRSTVNDFNFNSPLLGCFPTVNTNLSLSFNSSVTSNSPYYFYPTNNFMPSYQPIYNNFQSQNLFSQRNAKLSSTPTSTPTNSTVHKTRVAKSMFKPYE